MVKKAQKAAAALKKGQKTKSVKIHTRIRFFRRPTKATPSSPKYLRNAKVAFKLQSNLDKYSVIKKVLSTEKCMSLIEKTNVFSCLVHNRANKKQIRKAFEQLNDCKVRQVNTLVLPSGQKKAYIKLSAEHSAVQIANKMGII